MCYFRFVVDVQILSVILWKPRCLFFVMLVRIRWDCFSCASFLLFIMWCVPWITGFNGFIHLCSSSLLWWIANAVMSAAYTTLCKLKLMFILILVNKTYFEIFICIAGYWCPWLQVHLPSATTFSQAECGAIFCQPIKTWNALTTTKTFSNTLERISWEVTENVLLYVLNERFSAKRA